MNDNVIDFIEKFNQKHAEEYKEEADKAVQMFMSLALIKIELITGISPYDDDTMRRAAQCFKISNEEFINDKELIGKYGEDTNTPSIQLLLINKLVNRVIELFFGELFQAEKVNNDHLLNTTRHIVLAPVLPVLGNHDIETIQRYIETMTNVDVQGTNEDDNVTILMYMPSQVIIWNYFKSIIEFNLIIEFDPPDDTLKLNIVTARLNHQTGVITGKKDYLVTPVDIKVSDDGAYIVKLQGTLVHSDGGSK